MTTMTKRETQKRLIDLSIITISALALGGAYLLAARVDSDRGFNTPADSSLEIFEPLALAQPAAAMSQAPPVAGLIPAPAPRRRIVVIRRSRAS
jgi:hypothetical protein